MTALSNSYARLPEHFFARLEPSPVAQPRLIRVNRLLAADLGLDLEGFDDDTLAGFFSGNRPLPGAEAIATAYAGHQFGHFVPRLGDGRAHLLGEVRDRHGMRREIQLKGSGRTPFSRGGDGRAALGPVLREYLLSESMHALGVSTTRALAAVTSGEQVFRETALPGAIVTRVAASHIRVGTFQYFAAREDLEAIRRLADYVIDRLYPEAETAERPYLALLHAVIGRQAALVASWMQLGFIHGVMNTDNMAVSGETIDFGPCAFMDAYHPDTVFSSIDQNGRYAYSNQAPAAQWNLARFAETLLPLIDPDSDKANELATEAVTSFSALFARHWLRAMQRKLGLTGTGTDTDQAADQELVMELLQLMQLAEADYTLTFRALCDAADAALPADSDVGIRTLLQGGNVDAWLGRWKARQANDAGQACDRASRMRQANPAFIPRNHRVQQVITAAVERDDLSMFAEMLGVLSRPYDDQAAHESYTLTPRPDERVLRTFCGT
ncbi:MAG TPA: YdiU family protein [Steroidobacteraceae bacterium]|nr:YdiU family protein [Steroidobacteraceae bacterium]